MRRGHELLVNGERRHVEGAEGRSLLSVLRDELSLTGAKYGCGEGRCGACTVLIDGQPARSCVVRVEAIEGRPITTIEGLEQDGQLHPLQRAFLDEGAFQCGYCTPGMILAGVGLLADDPDPDETAIRRAMDGIICRCGTYPRIVAAVRRAAAARKGDVR